MGIAALHAILRRGSPVAAVQVGGFADKVRSYGGAELGGFASKLAPTKCQYPVPVLALALKDFPRNIRALRMPRSGGLVEAEFQGLSDMDVARAAMGQGWPFDACP